MVDLPTWTIRPNWEQPVVERLEWQTDVRTGLLGHEQRAATRPVRRRSLEALFTPLDSERTFAALMVQRYGAQRMVVPLWFDATRLTASAAAGTTTLYLDTANREYVAGEYLHLPGPDAFGGETARIATVAADHVTLTAGLANAWAAGSRVHPARVGWFEPGDINAVTSRVAEFSLRFLIDDDADSSGGAETLTLYNGVPLLSHRPNWSEQVGITPELRVDEFDPGQGPLVRLNLSGRSFSATQYGLLLSGRGEIADFRNLLHRLRGRQGPMWVPSFSDDVRIAANATSGSAQIDIDRIGIGAVGGLSDDLSHLLIGRDLAVHADALGTSGSPDRERLMLDTPLTRDVASGEKGSFLSLCRLEQDTVTLTHLTAEVVRSRLTWKSFTDGRDGSAAGHWPIPVTAMNSTPCGVVVAGPKVSLDFKNGVYLVNGASKTLGEIATADSGEGTYTSADVVSGVGLRTVLNTVSEDPFSWQTSAPLLLPEVFTAIGTNGFTAVLWYNLAQSGGGPASGTAAQVGLDYNDSPTAPNAGWGLGIAWGGEPGPYGTYEYDGASYREPIVATLSAGGGHKTAITLAPDRNALSTDGSATVVGSPTPPYTLAPAALFLRVSSRGSDGGSSTAILERIDFFDVASDSELPGLSTP